LNEDVVARKIVKASGTTAIATAFLLVQSLLGKRRQLIV
jgi:hypothetical protein